MDLSTNRTVWEIEKITDVQGVVVFNRDGDLIEGHKLPEKYELWAIAHASTVDKIYGNQRYCKVLLERKSIIGRWILE